MAGLVSVLSMAISKAYETRSAVSLVVRRCLLTTSLCGSQTRPKSSSIWGSARVNPSVVHHRPRSAPKVSGWASKRASGSTTTSAAQHDLSVLLGICGEPNFRELEPTVELVATNRGAQAGGIGLRHLVLPTEVPETQPARAPPRRLEMLEDQSRDDFPVTYARRTVSSWQPMNSATSNVVMRRFGKTPDHGTGIRYRLRCTLSRVKAYVSAVRPGTTSVDAITRTPGSFKFPARMEAHR